MDRHIALALKILALACLCVAAVLALAGFIEFLQRGRWPDQSLLRLGYDSGLFPARWFLVDDWRMHLRELLAWLSAAWVSLGLAPLFWWLGGILARR